MNESGGFNAYLTNMAALVPEKMPLQGSFPPNAFLALTFSYLVIITYIYITLFQCPDSVNTHMQWLVTVL